MKVVVYCIHYTGTQQYPTYYFSNVKNLQKINERELELGLVGKKSWHDKYKDSAWIFVGGLPYDLTEGDVICVFSQ